MSISRTFDPEDLAAKFKALSNPNRLEIFLQLAASCATGGSCTVDEPAPRCCVGELGTRLDVGQSTVSHHIKELRQAGLIRVERRGQNIDCWIDEGAVRPLAELLHHSSAACCEPGGDAAES